MSEFDVPGDCDCVSGGGERGARMRAFDWATTPLGSSEGWLQHLKDAIASHISAAIANAPGREDERRRAEAPPAEESLRESEARLRAVIEEAPLAIALTGRSDEILLRNPRFDQLWGRPAHVTTAPTYSEVYEGYHLDGRRIASEEWPGARAVLKGETIEKRGVRDRPGHCLAMAVVVEWWGLAVGRWAYRPKCRSWQEQDSASCRSYRW